MRLPGTINTKAGRNSSVCAFFSYHPDRLYSLSEFTPFLAKTQHRSVHSASWNIQNNEHDLTASDYDTITVAVLHQLDGHWRSNDFVGAFCPYSHETDHPGMHFSFNPDTGWGHCFGKHGNIPPAEMAHLLGVTISGYSSTSAA